jgi:hypothetical protein
MKTKIITLVLSLVLAASVLAKQKRFPATIDVTSQSIKRGGVALYGGHAESFGTLTVNNEKWLVKIKANVYYILGAGHYDVETDEQHKKIWLTTNKEDPRNPGKKEVEVFDIIVIEARAN